MLLGNKVAVLTGCNRGIGKKILEKFSNNGATIYACVRNANKEFQKYVEILEDKNQNKIEIVSLIKFIYFLIFFLSLFSIFLNREYLDKKKNLVIPFFVSFILLLYSLIIGNNSIAEYNNLFSILSLLIFTLVFVKYYKYE